MEKEDGIINGTFGIVPSRAYHDFGKLLGPTPLAVYMSLCIYADRDGHAWPSQERIAEDIAVDIKTVRRAIQRLVDVGLVEVKKPVAQGRGRFNRYLIVDKPLLKRGTNDTPLVQEGGHSTLGRGTNETSKGGHHAPNNYTNELNQEQGPIDRNLEPSVEQVERNRKALAKLRSQLKDQKVLAATH